MPQIVKYLQQPYRAIPEDSYGDTLEGSFVEKLHDALSGIGVKIFNDQNDPSDLSFFPTLSQIDTPGKNILDMVDENFFSPMPTGYSGNTIDNRSSHVNTPTSEFYYTPALYRTGNVEYTNVGSQSDIPVDVTLPTWFDGGTVDCRSTSSSNDSWIGWFYRLMPNQTYTFSFYAKQISGTGNVRFRIGAFTNTWNDGLSESLASNLYNQNLSFPESNVWYRFSFTFTTNANGYISMNIGAWSAWTQNLVIRVGFPQLEVGSTATTWEAPTHWTYHKFDTPVVVNDQINNTDNWAAQVGFSVPGSAVQMRAYTVPDFSGGGNPNSNWPRFRRTAGYDSSDTTTYNDNYNIADSWNQAHVFKSVGLFYTPTLGTEVFTLINYGNTVNQQMNFTIKGVYFRHRRIGGIIGIDTDNLSGPGHKKFLAWRIVKTGTTTFRFVISPIYLTNRFVQTKTFQGVYSRQVNGEAISLSDIQSNSMGTFVTVRIPMLPSRIAMSNISQNTDTFIDVVGNIQGFVINVSQNNSYFHPVIVSDFIDNPAAQDNGTLYPRWGMVLTNSSLGYVIVGWGPALKIYLYGHDRSFYSAGCIGCWQSHAAVPVPNYEVFAGDFFENNRIQMIPVYATRVGTSAANRGRLVNIFASRSEAFSGNVGDVWRSNAGVNYYLALRSSTTGGGTHNMYVQI